MQNREVLIWDIRSAVPTILVNPEEGGLGVVTCFSLDGNGTMALGMSRGIELIDYRCINKDFNRCPSPMPVEAIHLSDRVLSAWMYPLITNFFEGGLTCWETNNASQLTEACIDYRVSAVGTSVEGFTGSCDIVMAASKPKRSGKGEAHFLLQGRAKYFVERGSCAVDTSEHPEPSSSESGPRHFKGRLRNRR